MEKIKCPSCGALSSNLLNCDYCDSFMVRFARHGIVLENSEDTRSSKAIKKMQEELKANINEQINTKTLNHIGTTIKANDYAINVRNPRSLNDLDVLDYGCVHPNSPFDPNDVALVLEIPFDDIRYHNLVYAEKFYSTIIKNHDESQKFEWFKQAGLDKLFLRVDSPIMDEKGFKIGTRHYHYLNFGKDISGASKVITQYLFGSKSVDDDNEITYTRSSIDELIIANEQQKVNKVALIKKLKFWSKVAGICAFDLGMLLYDSYRGICVTIALVIGILSYYIVQKIFRLKY